MELSQSADWDSFFINTHTIFFIFFVFVNLFFNFAKEAIYIYN